MAEDSRLAGPLLIDRALAEATMLENEGGPENRKTAEILRALCAEIGDLKAARLISQVVNRDRSNEAGQRYMFPPSAAAVQNIDLSGAVFGASQRQRCGYMLNGIRCNGDLNHESSMNPTPHTFLVPSTCGQ
jgi:hypothetical protein